jgi:FMN phosphatase YigB (HAD superfamily)
LRVAVAVVLWDFGDTLVDERWMRQAPVEFPDWSNAWNEVMAIFAGDWNVGRATERDVFAAMSRHTGLSVDFVERHAEACCRSITFHPFAWQIAVERRRPQALVTVNPDLFIERVARPYGLYEHFDTIVVSCTEETDDKTTLCELALDRLALGAERPDALLIDNRRDHVEAWQRSGGAAYLYRGDDTFAADLPTLLAR